MKLNRYIAIFALSTLTLGSFSACNDFLSTLPDSRAEIDSYDKVRSLLVTAYPESSFALMGELASDNVIRNLTGIEFERKHQELYDWGRVTESNQDTPAALWRASYEAAQTANTALEAIEALGDTPEMKPLKAEALLCRAYAHFILATTFAEPYSPTTAGSKLGVVYMTKPEKELNPHYERESLQKNFEKIAADIETAIPMINDGVYEKPKYHFNRKAAYAFAARFYLYAQNWSKAREYATLVLGSNPANLLRDNSQITALPGSLSGHANRAQEWSDYSNKNNLMVQTSVSLIGIYFGPYQYATRYPHTSIVSNGEVGTARTAWGGTLKVPGVEMSDPYYKVLYPRNIAKFEYTNRSARTGLYHSVLPAFTTEETLLVRAEANIMLEDYAAALSDMNALIANEYTGYSELTEASIQSWFNSLSYHKPTAPTPKKALNPSWTINERQERILHVLLHLRRIETIQSGLRWYDINRYGIEVTRIDVLAGTQIIATDNVLTKDDKRRAFQIPEEAIAAGMTPNRQ